ncbi:MAG: retroviral-like aspartic protease [Ignavibacteriales bacterium]|nr:retroviral-like aspartic protease [Ignavibacteriales bacterium]
MVVPYTKYPPLIPGLGVTYRPILRVRFLHKLFGIRAFALIDSGADNTLLNKDYAKRLGVKWDSSTRIGKTHGIYGGAIPMYLHDIEMEIINYPNSRVQTTVAFVDLPNVDVLLGQIGFFEHYHVKFRHSAGEIDVEIPAQTP